MRPHTTNMEEIFCQKSTGITRVQNEPLLISKIHLEYAYGQLKLSEYYNKQSFLQIPEERCLDFTDSKKILRSTQHPDKTSIQKDRTLIYQTHPCG